MEQRIAWLRGLMDGEGCVGISPPQVIIQLHTKDIELLDRVKAIYDDLGIAYKEYIFNHQCQKRLVIHRQHDIEKFASLVGFTLERQQNKLQRLIASF